MFEYKGQKFEKFTEIIEHALSLKSSWQEEFVEAYAKSGPYALQNVGYVSGYYPSEKAQEILRVFKTAHPIFGTRTNVSPEEALAAGKALGEQAKNRDAS